MIPWGWLIVAAFGGAAIVYVLWACCVCSGGCSEDERRKAKCKRCMDDMEERLEQQVREHGRQRYRQALEDERGTGKKVYLDDVPVMTAEQYGAMLDEEEAG